MSVAAVAVAWDDDAGDAPLPGPRGRAVVDSLVARLHREYGGDRHELRCLVADVFGTFAAARVQTFVPLLVEKRLRETGRALRDGGGWAVAGPAAR